MGCGIGDFARRGLKMPKTQDFWVFILSPGDLDSQRHMGPRLAAQGGHSCTIGNMHVPGTSENQNRQFHEIHHFCPIFTIEYYIVAQKHIRQS